MTEPQERAPRLPPYFDMLFQRLGAGEADTATAFGRHVHWGYWAQPETAERTAEDYAAAAEAMCRQVCDAAGVRDGMRVLDVGCGFGGTIASLNERFGDLELVGVNIDPRQLERARELVRPRPGNRVTFVEADACRLPFPPGSFDVVLAVECVFHFPSRADFFAGAARVLSDGGTLTVSDFVPPAEHLPLLRQHGTGADDATRQTYGHVDLLCTRDDYDRLAAAAGLAPAEARDITEHTLPTYDFLRAHQRAWKQAAEARQYDRATGRLEVASRMGWLKYTILRFVKPAATGCVAA